MLGTVTSLATLPLRLAVRGATLLVRVAGQVVPGHGTPPVHPREAVIQEDEVRERPVAPPPSATAPAPRADAHPETPPAPPPAPASAPPTGDDHVSEEPVFVAEVADPGAEDGAGPEITVGEPWPGYAAMKAHEVVARLEEAAAAQVAMARLYEQANRGRKTVLDAAGRRLKALGA